MFTEPCCVCGRVVGDVVCSLLPSRSGLSCTFPLLSGIVHDYSGWSLAQIGLKPLQWLTQHMLKSNMSTQAVVQALRVCLVQFYCSNPLSMLALPATFAPPIAVPDAVAPPGCDPALWSSCYQLVATLPDKVGCMGEHRSIFT